MERQCNLTANSRSRETRPGITDKVMYSVQVWTTKYEYKIENIPVKSSEWNGIHVLHL